MFLDTKAQKQSFPTTPLVSTWNNISNTQILFQSSTEEIPSISFF